MKFAFAMLAVLALLLAGCASSPQQQAPAPPQASPPASGNVATPPSAAPPAPPATVPPANSSISLAELATHNTEADCWVGYDGQVYDITAFIPNHKNYQAFIVPLCGSSDQFKARFEGKHGMSKVSLLQSQPLMGSLGN